MDGSGPKEGQNRIGRLAGVDERHAQPPQVVCIVRLCSANDQGVPEGQCVQCKPHLSAISCCCELGWQCCRTCTTLVQVNIYVTELKSEALKERHWKDLMRRLRVHWVMTDLTLGQVWDVDLQRNEGVVKDVILVAQGEMGLEVFLRQVSLGVQSQTVHAGIRSCMSLHVLLG